MLMRVAAFAAAALALRAAGRNEASPNQAPAKDRGRELVEDVCTYCHNLDRLRGKQLSRDEWRGLIKGMISEGAPVTDEEFSMILDYLTKNYGKSRLQEPR
jgi:competence protein ComEA